MTACERPELKKKIAETSTLLAFMGIPIGLFIVVGNGEVTPVK